MSDPRSVDQPDKPVGRKRRVGLYTAVAAAVAAVVAAATAVIIVYTGGGEADTTAEANLLETAVNSCNLNRRAGVNIEDNGTTLVIDNSGEEDRFGVDRIGLECLLGALGIPASVMEHMKRTRALDGRQEDGWGRFTATWTYHPDNGLDVIITVKPGS